MPACLHPPAQRTVLFRAHDYVTADGFSILRCGDCGAVFTDPQPRGEQWRRYYPAEYYGTAGKRRFPRTVEWLQDRLQASHAHAVEQLAQVKAGRVLDIGCGRGLLLRAFQKRGWEAHGIEISEEAAGHARSLGLRVVVTAEEEIQSAKREAGKCEIRGLGNFADDQFDAVVMWHVLEHVASPPGVLQGVARVLKPGGVYLVGVPNFGSFEARLARDKWFHLDVPRHLSHFTCLTLCRQLADAGLQVERISFFAAEYDVFSFTQSALNRLGLRHNLLYNLLRATTRRQAIESAPLWQIGVTLFAAPLAGLTALPITLAAGLLGEGGTMTVFARKR